MGQKTNPRIFQLSKTSNWRSKCFEKKPTEYSKYSKKDLEIRGFIEKFFKNRHRTVHHCKICYFEKSLHIFVSYHLSTKLPSHLHGSIPNPDRYKKRKIWKEPCRVTQLPVFRCKITKSYVKQMSHRIKHPIKTSKLINVKILNKMLQFIQKFQKKRVDYLKKELKTLGIVISKYNKIKPDLFLNLEHLRKPVELLQELTRTLYNKKLRDKDDKKQKRTGELKDILSEKMADSLQYFTSRNVALWIHLKALNLNRSKKARNLIKDILKKNLIKLRRYQEEKFYREGINTFVTCSATRKPSALLAQFLAVQIKKLKKRKHNFFFKFIADGLKLFSIAHLSKTKRIKIKIKGRLNGRPKAKSRVLKIKKDVSVVRIRARIDYSEKTAFTSNGTIGIKVWIHEFSKQQSWCITDQNI